MRGPWGDGVRGVSDKISNRYATAPIYVCSGRGPRAAHRLEGGADLVVVGSPERVLQWVRLDRTGHRVGRRLLHPGDRGNRGSPQEVAAHHTDQPDVWLDGDRMVDRAGTIGHRQATGTAAATPARRWTRRPPGPITAAAAAACASASGSGNRITCRTAREAGGAEGQRSPDGRGVCGGKGEGARRSVAAPSTYRCRCQRRGRSFAVSPCLVPGEQNACQCADNRGHDPDYKTHDDGISIPGPERRRITPAHRDDRDMSCGRLP